VAIRQRWPGLAYAFDTFEKDADSVLDLLRQGKFSCQLMHRLVGW
jgi:hypothetical protein